MHDLKKKKYANFFSNRTKECIICTTECRKFMKIRGQIGMGTKMHKYLVGYRPTVICVILYICLFRARQHGGVIYHILIATYMFLGKYLSIYLSIHLSIFLSIYPSIFITVYLYIYSSNTEGSFTIFLLPHTCS